MTTEQEILTLLKSNQAFQNPLLDVFNTTLTDITNINSDILQTNVGIICDSIWPSNIPYPNEFLITDKNTIDSIKEMCVSTTNAMIVHTNTLSGSILTGEKNITSLLDLTITAKNSTNVWDKSKNINTHPLYESASVFFLTKEIIENLTTIRSSLYNSYDFLNNTSSTIITLNTSYPIANDQKTKLRIEINNISNQLSTLNTYLSSILSHDNTGWDSIQRRVIEKLFSIKLSSYSNVESEFSEYFKIIAKPKLLKILKLLK